MVVKVALVSFAHVHAPGHVEQLLKRSDVEVLGAFDDNEERGRHYANRYGLRLFKTIDELIKAKPDIAVIDSETSKHKYYIELLAESSIHLFCEKPIGVNLKDALEISNIVKRHGVLFTTGFNSRLNPENTKAREILSSGALGKVSMIRVRVAHPGAIDKWFKDWSEWFTVSQYSGGGGFLDLGIHGADLLRFLLNDEAVEVTGIVSNFTGNYNIDDQGAAVVKFSKGTLGILDAGWTQVLEGLPWSPLEIYGEEGSLIRVELGLMYYTRKQSGWFKPRLQGAVKTTLDELIDAVSKGSQLSVVIDDAVKAQEIIEAAYRSSAEGRVIKLPLT
ncbi:Gfo/Idh/MocA family protein [Caldivirga maquilingensis]|uniref:Oxidoreductase domain protein n=1 Tax=Caldivirga maquilingensis (strain ATCC 700844 / DSM 13496 / JCM 10307 / IC-167) TaxID=397948 RepID=A8ME12_CALMQ|nr:Gfo/Idh/MocA family oxidoreductase [Caldivirga maquilingensis]ABW02018.1 oxidoreductase domain protein [Caldivirga maquilingensis IC-167]